MHYDRRPRVNRIAHRVSLAASAILIAVGAQNTAASPDDFAKVWAIEDVSTAPYYEVALPDEALAATRQRWADAAVFDARGRPMAFRIVLDKVAGIGKEPVHVAYAQCTPEDDGARLRCIADPTPDHITGIRIGVRSKTFNSAIELRVLDATGTPVATYSNDLKGFLSYATIGFGAPIEGSSILIEGVADSQQIETVSMYVLPPEENDLDWREARLVRGEPGAKHFVYATDVPAKAYSAHLSVENLQDSFGEFHIGGCSADTCTRGTDGFALGAADFSKSGESYAVRLGTFGMREPLLSIETPYVLAAAPRLRIGFFRPRLRFAANGTPPYAFAVGGERPPARARSRAQEDIPLGKMATASLGPYRATFPSWAVAEYTGPALVLIALSIGGAWAVRKRR